MSGGEWTTQRERKRSRDEERERLRRLKVEWADKLWLAQNHPCDDAVLAWLSENRAEASRIGSSRWNLETLPGLVAAQQQLRQAVAFQQVLERVAIHQQTLTAEAVLREAGFPQPDSVETEKTPRKRRRDAGQARKRSSAGSRT